MNPRRFGRWMVLAALVAGCAGRPVAPDVAAHGNLLALVAKQQERPSRRESPAQGVPLVVLVENNRVRVVDPRSAEQWWEASVHVHGHPVAGAEALYVPVRGHRLVALDRSTGARRWEAPLPGEALTGLAASERLIVASVIDHRRGRSRLAGLSTADGQVRWLRRSNARFGIPATAGNLVVVSHAAQVLGLSLDTGREKARIDLPGAHGSATDGAPALERVALDRTSLLAGQGAKWVDLATSIGSRVDGVQTVDDVYASVFPGVDGLDPGHADAERLRLVVQFSATADAPRSAVLLCRRSIVAMRLSPKGRASVPVWAHLEPEGLEYVSLSVGATEVILVREDGQITRLHRRTGAVIGKVAGGAPVRGALVVGHDGRDSTIGNGPGRPEVRGMLVQLLEDPDPRLLPAQRLALDLLWRDEEPAARDVVVSIAESRRRPQTDRATSALREHALERVAGPWGRPDMPERGQADQQLSLRPSFLQDRRPAVAILARGAVAAGSSDAVEQLVGHLLHPSTTPADLEVVISALARMRRPEALDGAAEFVRRYHADPQIIHESSAVVRAVDLLLTDADPGKPQRAYEVLQEVVEDPFTDPSLRAYIAPRLTARRPSDELNRGLSQDAPRPDQSAEVPAPSL